MPAVSSIATATTNRPVTLTVRAPIRSSASPANGEQMWTFIAKRGVDSSPVIVGDRVFVGSSDGRLYGLDVLTGEEVWSYEAGGSIVASPAIADGRLIIANDDGKVFCFGHNVRTGSLAGMESG